MRILRSFGLVAAALLWAAAANAQPVITTGALPAGETTVPYSQQLSASDGDPACCTWAVTTGSLPSGLSLNQASGLISGTPTVAGGFSFSVTATDSTTSSDPAPFTIAITAAPIISPASLPAGEQGVSYAPTLTASGGTGSGFNWSQSGALPSNVQFNNGVFSGTPGAGSAGSYPITVTVTDSAGGTSGPQNYTILINPPPSISPATLPQGQVGVAYPTTTLTVTGGIAPYTWSPISSSLLAGLSFSNGVFSGTPTSTITGSSITAQVTDAVGGVASLGLSLTVISAPTITTASLPASDVGATYSQTLAATGGTPPYTWTVTAGSLPTGITLSSAGLLSSSSITGTTSTFTIKATDSAGGSDSQSYTLTVNSAMSITTASLPQGDAGKPYSQQFTLTGGTSPFTWTVASGLPTGITMSTAGLLSGTTSATGPFPFTAQVADAVTTATKALTLTINPALTITTAALAAGDSGAAYSQTLTASGGATPYTWSIPAISLPTGISLNSSTGVISGNTSSSGSFSITATLTDNIGGTATHPYTLVINPPLTITTAPTLANGSVGSSYSQTLSASGGASSSYTWSITSGSLGSLALNGTTGVISGTPTSSGPLTFTAQVTDAISISVTKNFTINITAGLTISTAPALPSGVVGTAYSQTLVAVGGTPGYTWSITAGSPPAGINLNPATGVLSGTPTSSGNASFTVQVTDSASGSASKAFTLTIASPLTITTAPSLPSGIANSSYSQTIAATGGTAPYAWSIISGLLPAGLSLNGSTGVLGGTPTSTGNFSFTVQVIDSASSSATKAFTLSIAGGLSISTAPTLPSGAVGTAYSQTLVAVGGTSPYSWSITLGALPNGLGLNPATGVISGTPTSSGNASFSVQVNDSASGTATKQFTLAISSPLTIATAPSLPTGTVNTSYSQTLGATGGTPPYSWSITSGSLPGGLNLNSTNGNISGTPTSSGNFSFTAQVNDVASGTASKTFSLTIAGGLSVSTAPSLPNATVGTVYGVNLQAAGGTAPYTWSITGGLLPGGLTLSPGSGAISGTPTNSGSFNFTVQVTDSSSVVASKAFSLTVAAALTITNPPTLPSGSAGVAYSQTLNATGGTAPFFLSISAGSLPAGLTLAGGAITGTPTSTGSFNFTVQVTDSASITATKQFSLSIFAGLTISSAPGLPNGTVGTAYSQTLLAVGGSSPYTWAIQAGGLPAGLTLNAAAGTISGNPTTGGTFNFTVQVTDSLSSTTTKVFTLAIASGLAITNAPALPSDSVGVAYAQTLTASGGTTPYTWSISAGTLPGGLSLSSVSGAIVGTPTGAGNFAFTVQVTDSASITTSKAFTLAIASGLTISNAPTLPNGTAGTAYSLTLAAVGGALPYTWSITAGSLPSGLTLNPATGAITGTPTAAGSFAFTARATDNSSATASKGFTLTIASSLNITTPPALPSGSANIAYSLNLGATGGAAPYSWSITAGSLPAGLRLDSASGAITGTPTSAGDVSFTVQITDSASITASKAFTLSIAAGLTISTAPTLPGATIGVPYSQTLIALGGRTPYAWSISAGSLPAGLTFNPTAGTITGTPTAGGAFGFTIRVTDSASVTATKVFSVNVSSGLTIVTAPTLPSGSTGVPYSAPLAATGGNPPYQWSISSGALPAGIALDPATGNLAGTTTNSGSFNFTAQVTDSASISVTKTFTFTIAAGLTIGTAPGLPPATLATPYSVTLAAVGGTAPYAWSISGGSLPGGLTLNPASGAITGSPASAGDFSFTVQVKDSTNAAPATKGFTLTVVGGLTITSAPSLPDGTINTAYSQALTAAGGSAPYTWSITAGSLPAGLALNALSGSISGSPVAVGTSTFTARATDRTNVSVTKQFTIKINSDLTITTPLPLQDGAVGTAYPSTTLIAAGGKPPYGWSIKSGALPTGLVLGSSTGTIGGTPTTAGDFSFTVQVADNLGATFTKLFSIHVAASALPNLTIGLPSTMDASQQREVILTLDSPYSADINGQITLAFQPDATVNVDDPAVQFASGGRTATFTIPANSTQPNPNPHIALQTGTVSGTITVTTSYQAAGSTGAPVTITQTVHIARAVANIRSVSVVVTSGGFEIHITGWSTPRNLTNAIVHLTPASGQNLQTTDLTVSVASVAQQWYASASSATFGSQFTLVLPFTISGSANAISAVSVELTNSVGTSPLSSASY